MLSGYTPFVGDDAIGTYSNIIRGDIHLPRTFDDATRSMLRHLLTADVTKRYGCLKGGAYDVQHHSVSLDALLPFPHGLLFLLRIDSTF